MFSRVPVIDQGASGSESGISHINIDGLLKPEKLENVAKIRWFPNYHARMYKAWYPHAYELRHGYDKRERKAKRQNLWPRHVVCDNSVVVGGSGGGTEFGKVGTVEETIRERRGALRQKGGSRLSSKDFKLVKDDGGGGRSDSEIDPEEEVFLDAEVKADRDRILGSMSSENIASFDTLEDYVRDPEAPTNALGQSEESETSPVSEEAARLKRLNPFLKEHRYDVPPTIEEMIVVSEGFAICGFKHFDFCQRVSQEILKRSWTQKTDCHEAFFSRLKPKEWGQDSATTNLLTTGSLFNSGSLVARNSGFSSGKESADSLSGPMTNIPPGNVQWEKAHLINLARLSLAFAQVGYRDNSFLEFVSQLLQARLFNFAEDGGEPENPISHLTLHPSTIVSILRSFHKLQVNDTELFKTILLHVQTYLHEYPANELAFIGYAIHPALDLANPSVKKPIAKMVKQIALEDRFLTLNGLSAAVGFGSGVLLKEHGWEKILKAMDAEKKVGRKFGEFLKKNGEKSCVPPDFFEILAEAFIAKKPDSREKYDVARVAELFAMFLGRKQFRENKRLINTFCKHLHRHLQYFSGGSDFLRFANAMEKTDYYDERALAALKKWANKRREEFRGGDWDRFEEKCARIKLKYHTIGISES